MEINECPNFRPCSAPICPLDPHWRESTHLRGERTCLYLRQAAKGLDLDRSTYQYRDMRPIVDLAYRQIINTDCIPLLCGHGDLRRALKEASDRPSKLAVTVPERKYRNAPQFEVTQQGTVA